MPFTPIESSVGGLLIGLSSSAHLFLNGDISGMSGIAGSCIRGVTVQGKEQFMTLPWIKSFLYILGLIIGGAMLRGFIAPQQFLVIPHSNPSQYLMFALGGLLVGIGTQLANGCTSGHMICGIARLSKRSFAAVMTFCGVAFLMVKLFHSIDMLNDLLNQEPSQGKLPFYTLPSWQYSLVLIAILLAVVIVYALVILTAKRAPNTKNVLLLPLYLFDGFVFALGLGLSGMVHPAKVLGFFDVFGSHFDPSLVCVAVGAILFDLVLFQTYILRQPAPVLSDQFCLPKASAIDTKLILGSVLFGIAWGTLGICPGPAIVNLATLAPQFIVFNLMFAVGVILKYIAQAVGFI